MLQAIHDPTRLLELPPRTTRFANHFCQQQHPIPLSTLPNQSPKQNIAVAKDRALQAEQQATRLRKGRRKRTDKPYSPGERVMTRTSPRQPRELATVILKRKEPTSYDIRAGNGSTVRRALHQTRPRLAVYPGNDNIPNPIKDRTTHYKAQPHLVTYPTIPAPPKQVTPDLHLHPARHPIELPTMSTHHTRTS